MPCVGRELRMLGRERMREIWEPAKAGSEPEDEEEKQACRAVKAHEELRNIWESADVIDEAVLEYPAGGVNPFVHIALHMVVEAQIEKNDPQGIREIAYSLESKGISRHEIVHGIGGIIAEEISRMSKRGNSFNPNGYMRSIRKRKHEYLSDQYT